MESVKQEDVQNKINNIKHYNYKNVHEDLEKGLYSGSYGWDNAAYIAIAEKKSKT